MLHSVNKYDTFKWLYLFGKWYVSTENIQNKFCQSG